jgi:hypothetical protein
MRGGALEGEGGKENVGFGSCRMHSMPGDSFLPRLSRMASVGRLGIDRRASLVCHALRGSTCRCWCRRGRWDREGCFDRLDRWGQWAHRGQISSCGDLWLTFLGEDNGLLLPWYNEEDDSEHEGLGVDVIAEGEAAG